MASMLIEVESNLVSPRVTKKHVRRVLKWVSPEDLNGLGAVRIIDERPNDPEYAKRPYYLSGFLYNGHYEFKTREQKAQVVLYAGDVYFGVPKILAGSSMATLKIARTLVHEIGHHVVATKGYLYQPWEKYKPWSGMNDPYEEEMVSRYAADVINRMSSHWRYKFGSFLTRKLSRLFYRAGLQEYWDENYLRSAQLEFRAYHLDPVNEEAGQCYRHAMEKLKTQTPSPLNEAHQHWLLHGYDGTPHATLKKHDSAGSIEKGRRKKRSLRARRST